MSESISEQARRMGIARSTLRDRMARGTVKMTPQPRREPEVDRLKAKVRTLESQLKGAEQHALSNAEVRERILGLAAAPREPVAFALPFTDTAERKADTPITIWSDWHYGETVRKGEVGGANEYNLAIADARVQRLVGNLIDLCLNHHTNPNYSELVVCLAGDLVSGEIHDELTQTNDGDLLPVVLRVVDILVWAFDELLRRFPRIYVPCVSGNHGRNTHKIQHKRFIYRNFDWLIYTLLDRHYKSEPRIEIDIPEDNQVYFDIFGRTYCLIHGHDLGVKGGNALIGSTGPVIRGRLKSGLAADSLGMRYDYLLLGHFHTYQPLLHSNGLLVNGSLIGFNEYARDNRFRFQPPIQSLHFHSPKRGVTGMWPVYVGE